MLTQVGLLQQVVFYAHFKPKLLHETWRADWAGLGDDPESHQRIDQSIDAIRRTTLRELRELR